MPTNYLKIRVNLSSRNGTTSVASVNYLTAAGTWSPIPSKSGVYKLSYGDPADWDTYQSFIARVSVAGVRTSVTVSEARSGRPWQYIGNGEFQSSSAATAHTSEIRFAFRIATGGTSIGPIDLRVCDPDSLTGTSTTSKDDADDDEPPEDLVIVPPGGQDTNPEDYPWDELAAPGSNSLPSPADVVPRELIQNLGATLKHNARMIDAHVRTTEMLTRHLEGFGHVGAMDKELIKRGGGGGFNR